MSSNLLSKQLIDFPYVVQPSLNRESWNVLQNGNGDYSISSTYDVMSSFDVAFRKLYQYALNETI